VEFLGRRTLRRRDRTLPVEDLATLLGLPPFDPAAADEVNLVIVQDGADQLGLIVSGILGREELVVKPVPLHLKHLKLVNGVTLDPDNQVIGVLDVPGLMQAARHQPPPRRAPAGRAGRPRPCILVVDDAGSAREVEKAILEARGYQVETAVDGLDALDKTRSRLYDLVLTDLEMPRMDGFALTEQLRADPRYQLVPVVIITSQTRPGDRTRGIQVGADAYLQKDALAPDTLADTVRNLIG
jgi:CheY-like chemotaxis protein